MSQIETSKPSPVFTDFLLRQIYAFEQDVVTDWSEEGRTAARRDEMEESPALANYGTSRARKNRARNDDTLVWEKAVWPVAFVRNR